MRKLLSLLTILTLTVPIPLNVIACDNTKTPTPPEVDQTDYLTLAATAKDKIQNEFAKLVNDGSNLRMTSNVPGGNDIMAFLITTDQKQDTVITQKKSKPTIDGFLEVLKEQVANISNNLVNNYPELKPLFKGINSNDILKINTNDLDTIFTNKAFDWMNNNFDLTNFQEIIKQNNITAWYYLSAKLKLDFTCLDENAKVHTTTIEQSYDMYFANDNSDLNTVVNDVTDNVKGKLDIIGSVKLDYPQWNDSFVNQKNIVLNDINSQLIANQELKKIKDLEINKLSSIDNPYNNDYNYMNVTGNKTDKEDAFPLSINEAQKITTEQEFKTKWDPTIATRETNFATRLETWKNNNGLVIDKPEKVFVFGEYQTTNWKISGLEIKPLSIPYYITSTSITRAQNTSESLNILEKLFVGDNALFKWGKNWTNSNREVKFRSYDFNLALNPDVYDGFKTNDVTIQKIYDYVTTQTNNFGTKGGFINASDKVQWTTGGSTDWLNHSISTTTIPSGIVTKNWRLVINGNAFAMSIRNNSGAEAQKYNAEFSITKADENVWPE